MLLSIFCPRQLNIFIHFLFIYFSFLSGVAFVLDHSGSVGIRNFRKVQQFLINIIRSWTIGYNKLRVTVVSFSNHAFINFYINRYSNKYTRSQEYQQSQMRHKFLPLSPTHPRSLSMTIRGSKSCAEYRHCFHGWYSSNSILISWRIAKLKEQMPRCSVLLLTQCSSFGIESHGKSSEI